MWMKPIKASRPTIKGLLVGFLVVFLSMGVVCGAALPEEINRLSPAMETSSLTQISSFNKRHLRTNAGVMSVAELEKFTPPKDLISKLQNFFEIPKATGADISNLKILHEEAVNALPIWHNEVLLKSSSPEHAYDIVLYNMIRYSNTEDRVESALIHGKLNGKDAEVKKLCSSLLDRLSWARNQVEFKFEQLKMNYMDVKTLFDKPAIRTLEKFVKNFWSERLGMAIDSPEVQHAADDSILSVLTAKYGVDVLTERTEHLSFYVEYGLPTRLYQAQLRAWSEPSVSSRHRDVADQLKIKTWTTTSDSDRLSIWFDYMVLAIWRAEPENLKRELVLQRFRETFNKKIINVFEGGAVQNTNIWAHGIRMWKIRLESRPDSALVLENRAKRFFE